jgi:hypothetical protein
MKVKKTGDYKLVIVMDGVDELKREFARNNLYDNNDLELWRERPNDSAWPKVLACAPRAIDCCVSTSVLSGTSIIRSS